MPLGNRVLQYVESQAAHIESRVRMIEYGDIQYPGLIGISREASPNADTIIYYSTDGSGKMADIGNSATDFPFVEVTEAQHSVPIHWKGLAYGWTIRDIGRAMEVGMPLQDRKVRQAFRTAEEEKERVFLYGDAAKGWDGMINNSSVTATGADKTWMTSTAADIFKEVNELLAGVWVDSNQVRIANTLLLPVDIFAYLQNPMGDNADKSIMDYIKMFNIYTAQTGNPLMIRTVRQLSTAGDSSSKRAVAYTRDMNVVRYHIPQDLTFLSPQQMAMSYVYYGYLVLGGVEIMEPTAFRYLDAI